MPIAIVGLRTPPKRGTAVCTGADGFETPPDCTGRLGDGPNVGFVTPPDDGREAEGREGFETPPDEGVVTRLGALGALGRDELPQLGDDERLGELLGREEPP